MWLPCLLCAATFCIVIGLGVATVIECCRQPRTPISGP